MNILDICGRGITLGLRTADGKYLTCETFGDNMNLDSKELRPKQHFVVTQKAGTKEVTIKTLQGKFLAGDAKGKLTASSTSAEKNETWTVDWLEDGRWTFKSASGNYLSSAKGVANADGRSVGDDEKWFGHLSIHPQTCFFSCSRKAYVHLVDGELVSDELVPWGADPLLNLTFNTDGKFSIQALSKKYLDQSGSLVDSVSDSSKYIMVFNEGKVSFKCSNGKFLTCAGGGKGKVSGGASSAGVKESFIIEDSFPQFTFMTNIGKYFTQTGNETSAKEKDVSDATTFQMEHRNGKFAFLTNQLTYFTCQTGKLEAHNKTVGENELFDVEWHGGFIAIKGANGKYVTCKPNGGLPVNGTSADEASKFVFTLINRPVIALKNINGFIGLSPGKDLLTCNHLTAYYFNMTSKNGVYSLATPKGEYWKIIGDEVYANADEGAKEEYYLEFLSHSKFAMKSVHSGKYMTVEQKGSFKPNANSAGDKELLEY